MSHRIDAIFSDGVFKPLVPVHLQDKERVSLTIESANETAQRELTAWQAVYAELSTEDVADLDAIVRDRSRFMRPEG